MCGIKTEKLEILKYERKKYKNQKDRKKAKY